ncbi:MAG: glycosyltransferase family 4 protein [Candidatus Hydrogenedentota bacterium]
MRILMLTEVFHPDTIGGAGRVAAELARELAADGHELRIITRITKKAGAVEESRHGFRLYRYPLNLSTPIAAYRSTAQGVTTLLDKVLDDFHPDVLDIHQPHIASHALKHRLLRGLPSVYTFHSSWADEMKIRGGVHALISPMAGRIEREVLRRFSLIVTLSEYSRRRAIELAKSAVIEIIPGGVGLAAFPLKKAVAPKETPVLLTVRNLVRRMGIDSLIRAAHILRQSGRKIRLEIGGTGSMREELETLARSLNVDCHFLGFIPEDKLSDLYQRADLFVLPTAAIEGFGLVILEAFASGTPVVGTPIGAIPEVVGLQGHGYVSATSAPEDLARSIADFLDRQDKPRPEALRTIAEEFSWTKRMKRMTNLYSRVTQS